ncbi:PilZ domain-containing protein [Candidatus Aminicenantes bacterium AC-335-B20]|jgi:hypothetical protein|nr:PilZ domain-containing protein [SCandidatus Aminicenantes bacterium Aminicenantia_JdfR_composite]MCP2596348.1 PilZ domain-containing protein [Candidatus Aminicenantes bacterium AC-335-G13]MCP2599016.1 PilZ domain-containing protein [Candidatus Aminicenantes bacterium AC-335-B20]MCP2605411.1 PilZ domain-containing protein [Candidatus Aminicenantes bacterium AC-335-O07]MCP2605979.1 PilZ domain-containing protein [Candidatus Aminicenantes bacterium AC-708-I09]MCP2617822.1 PilZ domain-containin
MNNKKITKIEFLRDFIIKNISEGGILIEATYSLPLNSTHFLRISYKELDFSIKGIVKRIEKDIRNDKEIFKIAFEFIEVNSKQRNNLKEFINLVKKG